MVARKRHQPFGLKWQKTTGQRPSILERPYRQNVPLAASRLLSTHGRNADKPTEKSSAGVVFAPSTFQLSDKYCQAPHGLQASFDQDSLSNGGKQFSEGGVAKDRSKGDSVVQLTAELAKSQEREAALHEILQLISQSREDATPVFNVILKNAAQLCGAPLADLDLIDESGTLLSEVATWGHTPRQLGSENWSWSLDSDFSFISATLEGRIEHVADIRESDKYRSGNPTTTAAADVEGMRTFLSVPLISAGKSIGCIILYRTEVAPFSNIQIALVETFAAQAVIAIENAHQFRELQARLERESATKNILEIIGRTRDNDGPVFEAILENAASLCHADRAALLLKNSEETHLEMNSVFGRELPASISKAGWSLDGPHAPCQAVRFGKIVHIPDLRQGKLYKSGDPTQITLVNEIGLRTVLAVPLIRDNQSIGAIVLHRLGEPSPFTEDDISLIETFARQAVIAIDNMHQFKALEALNAELGERVEEQVGEIERMAKLKRFLPAAVADTVVGKGSDEMLSSHRALLGVLFCDIRGFTAFCETAEPEETIEVLQTYHEEMGKLINAHNAGVDHRMGDGIMVLFNDPLPCDDPAGEAVRLALSMRDRMIELCKKWKRLGHRLGFGVGISLGYATVGMVGYEGRYDYTASGTAVNLAARLCDLAEDGEILLSPRANTAIEDDFSSEPTGEVTLKGISAPVEVFRLLEHSA